MDITHKALQSLNDCSKEKTPRIGVPRRLEGIVVKDNDGALAVSNPLTSTILLTNKVGGKILDLVDGTRNVDAICEALAGEFQGVDRSKLHEHVTSFLASSVQNGILSFTDQPAPVLQMLNITPNERTNGVQRDSAAQQRKFHPDIYWYLTFRCNLACTHCSVLSSPHVDTSTDLKTDKCMEVVEQMAEMSVSTALLSGGEPLIRPDALKIMRALADKEIYVGLETNGLKIEKEFINMALELQSRNLMNMTVSLDGGTAETHSVLRGPGSFERTLRGLRLLHHHGVKFDIQCILNRESYKTIPNLYDLVAEVQPEILFWSPLNSSGRGSTLIRRLGLGYAESLEILDLIDRHKARYSGINIIKLPPAMVPPRYMIQVFKGKDVGCSTGCKFPLLGILPNGDITVCAVSRHESSLHFGNVCTHRLKSVWEKARMDLLRTRYVSAEELQGICGDCVWKYTCKGACRAKAYEDGGDFFAPFPICQEAANRGEFPDVYRISKGAYANRL